MLHVCTCTYSVCAGTFICTISPTEAVKLLEKVVKDREKILYKYNRQLGASYNMLARALAMQGQTALTDSYMYVCVNYMLRYGCHARTSTYMYMCNV